MTAAGDRNVAATASDRVPVAALSEQDGAPWSGSSIRQPDVSPRSVRSPTSPPGASASPPAFVPVTSW